MHNNKRLCLTYNSNRGLVADALLRATSDGGVKGHSWTICHQPFVAGVSGLHTVAVEYITPHATGYITI